MRPLVSGDHKSEGGGVGIEIFSKKNCGTLPTRLDLSAPLIIEISVTNLDLKGHFVENFKTQNEDSVSNDYV